MADDPASERPGDGVDAGGDAPGTVDRVAALESSVEELEAELDEMIRDVRERVIQVKRETDAKAPADHDHPELAERLDRLAEDVGALGRDYVDVDDDLVRLDERVDEVEDRLSAGFSNYEEVLEYLVETTDELDRKLEAVLGAVADVRRRADRVASADAERAAADRLRNAAQENGVTAADCEECGGTVQLGLLTAPNCPHCGVEVGDVEPKSGFFGSATLRAGTRPALEGDVEGASGDLDDLLSSDRDEAPSVGHGGGETPEPPAEGPATGRPGEGNGLESPTTGGDPDAPDEEPATGGAGDRDGPAPGGADGLEVDAISGIGSAYSDRLAEAGVETVGELALADPERLAGATEIPRDRVDGWIDRARQMTESD